MQVQCKSLKRVTDTTGAVYFSENGQLTGPPAKV